MLGFLSHYIWRLYLSLFIYPVWLYFTLLMCMYFPSYRVFDPELVVDRVFWRSNYLRDFRWTHGVFVLGPDCIGLGLADFE